VNRVRESESLISEDEVFVLVGSLEDVVVVCRLILEPVDGALALIAVRRLFLYLLEGPSLLGSDETVWACVFCDLIAAEHWSVSGRARSGGGLGTLEDLFGPSKMHDSRQLTYNAN